MLKKLSTSVWIILLAIDLYAQAPSENLFYMTETPESFESFQSNLGQISIVCPQVFLISKDGVLSGSIDPRVLDLANKNKIKVMPLIVNKGFNTPLLHAIVINPQARRRSIQMMLDYAGLYHLDGWQFDLEGLNITDRDSFTVYFRETAQALHRAGMQLSAALVHTVENLGGPTAYHNFLFENWRAGYSFKELAEAGDFLSIMSYDQHTRRTPPGPVAGIDWVTRIIDYLLSEGVPKEKISMGIPNYSVHWFPDYTDDKGGFSNGQQVGYKTVQYLIGRYNAQVNWDEKSACHYTRWDNDGVNEYMYIEDGASLKPKLDLMKKYKLRGISVWVLGKEAPEFWSVLQKETITKK
jgi:spore germination protein YaaH